MRRRSFYEGTRLINAAAPESAAPVPRSASARVLANVVDRLTFVRPDLRLPVAIGAGGSVLLALAIAIVVILTPIGGPASSIATARPEAPSGRAASPPNGPPAPASPAAGGVKVGAVPPGAPANLPAGNGKPPTSAAPTALPDIIQAATRGDPAAENALGVKYAQGADGLPRDETLAV